MVEAVTTVGLEHLVGMVVPVEALLVETEQIQDYLALVTEVLNLQEGPLEQAVQPVVLPEAH